MPITAGSSKGRTRTLSLPIEIVDKRRYPQNDPQNESMSLLSENSDCPGEGGGGASPSWG